VISINGALSVDLVGQVVADRIGEREHSGIGGHEDFVSFLAQERSQDVGDDGLVVDDQDAAATCVGFFGRHRRGF